MKTILKIACMFCGGDMGEKDGQGVEGVSHSICESCWHDHFPRFPYPEGDFTAGHGGQRASGGDHPGSQN